MSTFFHTPSGIFSGRILSRVYYVVIRFLQLLKRLLKRNAGLQISSHYFLIHPPESLVLVIITVKRGPVTDKSIKHHSSIHQRIIADRSFIEL